jgi:hypothetical protein
VSELHAWVACRGPRPPSDLDAALRGDLEGEDTLSEALACAGRVRLEAALSRPGRVRESAFELLASDALVTYACEAALESPDPVSALEHLFTVGAVR